MWKNERGMALITMLLLLSALSLLAAGAVVITNIDLRMAGNYYQNSRAFYAAEAGVEKALSDIQSILDGQGTITDKDLAEILQPELRGFSFDEYKIERSDSSFVRNIDSGPYLGMVGLYQPIDITSKVVGPGNSRYSIMVAVNGIQIPIFQFGVFYNDSLEIHNGAQMDMIGRVHTNSDFFPGTTSITYFHRNITVAGDLYRMRIYNEEKFLGWNKIMISDPDSNWTGLNYDTFDYLGNDEGWVVKTNEDFGGRLRTRAHNITPLGMPIPREIEPVEIIKRRDDEDGAALRLERLDWKADLRIYVDSTLSVIDIMDRSGAPVVLVDPAAIDTSYEAFYDDREKKWVDLVVVDVSRLTPGDIGNGIVYISIEEQPGRRKGIKLIDCSTLPGPISFCSDNAVYVQGDYNTGDWQPSAVMADAVNLLSNAWSDAANRDSTGGSANNASSTTYYLAILSGDTDNTADYNGGLENFPRFLEKWSVSGNRTCTIYGSFVNLFLSENADGPWFYGNPVYEAPIRNWWFDVRFLNFNQLPPGTPAVGSVLRIAFRQEFMG
ncbi:MAG: pilus assembly PilX N-terminal domain-containing protein [Candidatus Glassbacteria bacterium]|nr:pilus assembly PilX N-terminal domain-containing protein [Candidatus Glassbacteria bacterium]